MKKKFTTLFIACFALFTVASAQQYNLFDPADVDADGWIWFDTQAKIDKYIGQAGENGSYDPNGKMIQLVDAVHGLDYISCEASADLVGAGTDGLIGGPGARTGGIKVVPSSGLTATDGGCVVIGMPSCVAFNVAFSSENRIFLRFLGTTSVDTRFAEYNVIDAKHASGLANPLSSAGQAKWENMENLTGSIAPYLEIKSSSPIYGMIQNMRSEFYIHGMKILTSTPTSIDSQKTASSISFDGKAVSLASSANINVYTVAGGLVASEYAASMDLSNLPKGFYIVKADQETIKVSIR